MNLPPFRLERFFAQHEFSAPHNLCASDGEALSMAELLALADDEMQGLWHGLSLGYTESAGHPLLRQEIARLYEQVAPADTLVLVPEEGIFLAMQALLRPGDRVVAAWPAYQSLYQIAASLGCEMVRWEPRFEDGTWRFSLNQLASLLTAETRLLVINFPHNPTGAHLTHQEQAELVALAQTRGVRIFCDEMYRGSEHDPAVRLPSVVDLAPNALVLSGLSKSYTLPGLRLGWLVTRDTDLWQALAQLKDYTTICHSAPSEILAIIALRARDQITARLQSIIAHNLALLDAFFAEHGEQFVWRRPKAGTIAFPMLLGQESVDDFCQRLLIQEGVLLAPASAFDYQGPHLRIGFGRRSLAEGIERLAAFLA